MEEYHEPIHRRFQEFSRAGFVKFPEINGTETIKVIFREIPRACFVKVKGFFGLTDLTDHFHKFWARTYPSILLMLYTSFGCKIII